MPVTLAEMVKIPNDAYHETVRVEKPDCHLWIDVVDENGDLLMRVGVHPNDSYHKRHGRVTLAYQSRDLSETLHWNE